MRTITRLATAVGACAIAIGLAACTPEPEDPADGAAEESTAVAEETAEPEPTEAADPRMEAIAGEWEAEIGPVGDDRHKSLTIDTEGNVSYLAPRRDWQGTVTLSDTDRHQLDLEPVDAPGTDLQAWELVYDAEADTLTLFIPNGDLGDEDFVYIRVE